MPTVLDIAGLTCPNEMEGTSLLPYLAGETKAVRDYLPLVFNQNFGITDGRWKYCWFGDEGLEMLFDLDEDPRECHDLSELPAFQDERNRMRGALRDHLAKHNDPHVVDGELTVRPPRFPVEDSRFGDKGMHRGRA